MYANALDKMKDKCALGVCGLVDICNTEGLLIDENIMSMAEVNAVTWLLHTVTISVCALNGSATELADRCIRRLLNNDCFRTYYLPQLNLCCRRILNNFFEHNEMAVDQLLLKAVMRKDDTALFYLGFAIRRGENTDFPKAHHRRALPSEIAPLLAYDSDSDEEDADGLYCNLDDSNMDEEEANGSGPPA
jgi:hypothetical protein